MRCSRSPVAGVKVPAHERIVLPNGMTLIVMPRHDIPLVSFNAVLKGGESAAAPGKSGVASLVAGLLEKGAGKRDAFAFVDAVEGVGGTFNAAAGPESIAIRGQFLARDQQLMLELLADALLRPRFKLEELENLRDRQIELIKAAKDSDPVGADRHLRPRVPVPGPSVCPSGDRQRGFARRPDTSGTSSSTTTPISAPTN